MNEETQTQIRQEGDAAFPTDSGNDNPSDLSSVNEEGDKKETDTDQTPLSEENKDQTDKKTGGEDEEDRGFVDHPKWKKREEDWKERFNEQETRHTDEITKLREDFEENLGDKGSKAPVEGEDVEIPYWFNGDTKQFNDFLKWNQGLLKEQEGAIRKALTEESEAEQKKLDEATTWANDEISAIEVDKKLNPSGEKIDRNKLMAYVLKNRNIDEKGRWNWRQGFRYMNLEGATKGDKARQEKKQVASATSTERRADTKDPDVVTSKHYENPGNRPW